jgi:site-specific DNA-methyltransferase (adenine-specific)
MKKTQIVISGDNVETLKNYPDNYFDSIVTDCPYGLGKEPNAQEMLKAWIDTGYLEVKGSGFMGKEWDSFVPQPLFWKEIYRVLKHGGHIVAFFGTRTYDWGCMAIRLGGFEIRDCIQWVYGSGFPKSHNISKAIDKMKGAEREVVGKNNYSMPKADNSMGENSYGISGGKLANGITAERIVSDITMPSTEEAKQWDGWGSALKPANEPIVLARKPLEKGLSIAENVLKWGTGAINIDGCRVGLSNKDVKDNGRIINRNIREGDDGWGMQDKKADKVEVLSSQGRFPSNFIMSHHEDCEDLICVDDCPIKILDEQSGISKTGDIKPHKEKSNKDNRDFFKSTEIRDVNFQGDKGGASRFFYVAKASQWERNYGLDEFEKKTSGSLNFRNLSSSGRSEDAPSVELMGGLTKSKSNFHPTIKPIKLMQYLVRLVTPQNGIVLDPFAGSGTTGIACKIDGFEFVGLELSEEYTAIANKRIESFNEENLLLDDTTIFKNRNKTQKSDTNTKSKEQLNLF